MDQGVKTLRLRGEHTDLMPAKEAQLPLRTLPREKSRLASLKGRINRYRDFANELSIDELSIDDGLHSLAGFSNFRGGLLLILGKVVACREGSMTHEVCKATL